MVPNMNEQYFECLRKYRRLLVKQRFAWLVLLIVGLCTIFLSKTILDSEWTYVPIILSLILVVYIGNKIQRFKCPRCEKTFCTKYVVLHYRITNQCVHCGLSLNELPELKGD